MKSSFVFGGGGSSGSRGTGNPSFNRSRSRVASQSVRRQDRTICPRRSAPWIPSATRRMARSSRTQPSFASSMESIKNTRLP